MQAARHHHRSRWGPGRGATRQGRGKERLGRGLTAGMRRLAGVHGHQPPTTFKSTHHAFLQPLIPTRTPPSYLVPCTIDQLLFRKAAATPCLDEPCALHRSRRRKRPAAAALGLKVGASAVCQRDGGERARASRACQDVSRVSERTGTAGARQLLHRACVEGPRWWPSLNGAHLVLRTKVGRSGAPVKVCWEVGGLEGLAEQRGWGLPWKYRRAMRGWGA